MAQVTKQKRVRVMKMDTPKAITLTASPANQVGFKIVRSDGAKPRVRRVRNSIKDGFLFMSLPGGLPEEEVQAVIDDFGLSGCSVDNTDKEIRITRSDFSPETPHTLINIGDGRKVAVARSEPETGGDMQSLKLISLSFSKEVFASEEQVREFMQASGVENSDISDTEDAYVVNRSDEPEDASARNVTVTDGVTFTVTRAEEGDIPEVYYPSVNEAAYGSWGWGQLDFYAAMADVEFCELGEEASRMLSRVCEQILFSSYLANSVRKDLIFRAVSQYALYMGSLIDGLPQNVVIATRSDTQEKRMTTQETKQEEKEVTPAPETITRADVESIVTAAVATAVAEAVAALAPKKEEVARTDTPAAEAPKEDVAVAAIVASQKEMLETITRSVKESMDSMATAVKGVGDRVAAIESATVVRSDAADSGASQSRSKDVFQGVFTTHMK